MICFFFTGFTGSQVGLAITQSMALTGVIQWGMRQSAEVTNQLMSVERVLEYTQLPPEPNLKDKGILAKDKSKWTPSPPSPPKDWPSRGCLRLSNVYMRYAEDDAPVLKGLTLVIRPGEKVSVHLSLTACTVLNTLRISYCINAIKFRIGWHSWSNGSRQIVFDFCAIPIGKGRRFYRNRRYRYRINLFGGLALSHIYYSSGSSFVLGNASSKPRSL